MKLCSICNKEKEISDYYTYNKKRANGEEFLYIPPYCKECTKVKSRKWALDNPETVVESNRKMNEKRRDFLREYKRENKQLYKEYTRRWQLNNKERVSEYNKFRLNKVHTISKKEWEDCKTYFNYSCAYCGVSETEHKKIHKQQLNREHVDHNGANDLSNCIPACRPCNSSKRQYSISEWYNDLNENFTYERLNKINQWLENDYKEFLLKE